MNCNHFSSDLTERLTGQAAPTWINRLASIAVSLHCLLPTGWVPPLRPPTAPPPLGDGLSLSLDQQQHERSSLLDPMERPSSSSSSRSGGVVSGRGGPGGPGPPRSAPQLIS